jgi:hypothetical protein
MRPLSGAAAVLVLLVSSPSAGANVFTGSEVSAGPPVKGLLEQAAPVSGVPRSVDESFAAVAARVPAFAGAYIDWPTRTLQIRMTDAGQSAALAKRALIDVTGNPLLDRLRPVARKADYGFRQLKSWYDRIAPTLLTTRGTVFTDIDERQNRLIVGMERPSRQRAAFAGKLRALGIPRGVVRTTPAQRGTEQQAPTCQNLQSRCRPLVGGLQIESKQGECTLGFVARSGSSTGFVTSAHCTKERGRVDGTIFAQPSLGETVGLEALDPGFTSPPGDCPRGDRCRWSEAVYAISLHHSHVARGAIAMPPAVNTTGAETCPGEQSCKYDGTNRFSIVFKLDPLVGQPVAKVGRTSGLTTGKVTRTCVPVPRRDGTFLCQSQADFATLTGDSGSAVFTPLFGSGFVVLGGMFWAGNGTQVFSPISGIQRDMGTLGVCSPPILDLIC